MGEIITKVKTLFTLLHFEQINSKNVGRVETFHGFYEGSNSFTGY